MRHHAIPTPRTGPAVALCVGLFLGSVALAAPGDQDDDGVSDEIEDRNGDGDPTNDDRDADDVPDGLDPDDDGDGVLTRDEDANGDGDPTNDLTDLYGPEEGPDYLNDRVPTDRDHDEHVAPAYGGDDCDDTRVSVNPGVDHDPLYDGEDRDCDGGRYEYDGDRDGWDSAVYRTGGEDCDDYDPEVHPEAVEGTEDPDIDRDCDGWIDPLGTLVPDGGCDCGHTGVPAGLLWSVVGLVGVVARRRA